MYRGTHSAIGFSPYIKTCENGLHELRDRAQNFAVADDPVVAPSSVDARSTLAPILGNLVLPDLDIDRDSTNPRKNAWR